MLKYHYSAASRLPQLSYEQKHQLPRLSGQYSRAPSQSSISRSSMQFPSPGQSPTHSTSPGQSTMYSASPDQSPSYSTSPDQSSWQSLSSYQFTVHSTSSYHASMEPQPPFGALRRLMPRFRVAASPSQIDVHSHQKAPVAPDDRYI